MYQLVPNAYFVTKMRVEITCSSVTHFLLKFGWRLLQGFIPSKWTQLVDWSMRTLKRGTSINILGKIALHACIYQGWKERNSRVPYPKV